MLKRQGNRSFERLPNIRDAVVNGNMLLTVHDQSARTINSKIGYEQGRETKIYKRTRMNVGSPRQKSKLPASLLLSGTNVFDHSGMSLSQSMEAEVKNTESENGQLPPVENRIVLLEPSTSFYNDYGLQTHSSDSFSGYRNFRTKKNKKRSYLEKEIEKKAMKHIHAIQVVSSSKRGSYAVRSVNSLKETLSPLRSNTEVVLPTSYVRSENTVPQDRHPTFVDVSKKAPYNMLIKTREGHRLMSRRENPLPEISGRTVLGFDTKYGNESPMKEYAYN